MPRSRLIRLVAVAGFLATTIVGSMKWIESYDWAMIQRATGLRAPSTLSKLEIIYGPSTFNQLWAVVRFYIPPDAVPGFVADHRYEPSDRVTFVRYRHRLPAEVQTLPSEGKHFHKQGETISGMPYEILTDSSGLVVVYVMLDD